MNMQYSTLKLMAAFTVLASLTSSSAASIIGVFSHDGLMNRSMTSAYKALLQPHFQREGKTIVEQTSLDENVAGEAEEKEGNIRYFVALEVSDETVRAMCQRAETSAANRVKLEGKVVAVYEIAYQRVQTNAAQLNYHLVNAVYLEDETQVETRDFIVNSLVKLCKRLAGEKAAIQLANEVSEALASKQATAEAETREQIRERLAQEHASEKHTVIVYLGLRAEGLIAYKGEGENKEHYPAYELLRDVGTTLGMAENIIPGNITIVIGHQDDGGNRRVKYLRVPVEPLTWGKK